MRWRYLIVLTVIGYVVGEEDKSEPVYKPLVSPEEMEYIDNAEIQEILGNLQVFYDRLKMEATTLKPEITSPKIPKEEEPKSKYPPRYIPQIHMKPEIQEPQTTYATERSTTTTKPQPHFDQAAILNHPDVQKMIQESISQAKVPHEYSPPTQQPVKDVHPAHQHNFHMSYQQPQRIAVPQIDIDSQHVYHELPKNEHSQYSSPHIFHSIAEPQHTHHSIHHKPAEHMQQQHTIHHKPEDHIQHHKEDHLQQHNFHKKPEDHILYHQPQLHDHHTHLHAQLETPHVVVPHSHPSPRQEIEIEYQYQPHARVIGHLTEDQQVRLYKNKSPDVNKIVKDMKYYGKKYDPNYHDYEAQRAPESHQQHYEAQRDPESHFESQESHFPQDAHFQSEGAKVELMDKQSTDELMYGNRPGFHLDENQSNYYIEPLK